MKWIGFVRDSMACMDIEDGKASWRFLPNSGGYYDQDWFIMTVWEKIREKVIHALNDKKFIDTLRSKHGKSEP